jgi:hypothetical protein
VKLVDWQYAAVAQNRIADVANSNKRERLNIALNFMLLSRYSILTSLQNFKFAPASPLKNTHHRHVLPGL